MRIKRAFDVPGLVTALNSIAAKLVCVTDTRGKVWRCDGRTGEGGLVNLDASVLAAGRRARCSSSARKADAA